MVKITMVLDGEVDDVLLGMRRLLLGDGVTSVLAERALVEPVLVANVEEPAEQERPVGKWDPSVVRAFWDILAPQAREVYRRVSAGNRYVLPRVVLLQSMGVTPRELSGRLSSQGHALRRLQRLNRVLLPHPMRFDVPSQEYRMLSAVGDVIGRL